MSNLKNITFLFIISLLPIFWSCRDDLKLKEINPGYSQSEELAISFDLSWPEESNTRTILDQYGNERFSNTDMIHILGTFNTESLNEDGTTTKGIVSRYGALYFDGKNWVAKEGSNLTWPAIATSGSFIAYYINESNGLLTGSNPTENFSLSELTPITDPLYAQSSANIPYGNGVKLEFSHLCAFLTIVDLEPQVSDSYMFMRPGELTNKDVTPAVFNNAFQIKLGEGNYGPTLEFSFLQAPDPQYNNLVFISAERIINEADENNPYESTSVQFFLEPGYYDTFQLAYPANYNQETGYYEYYKYIEYNYNNQQAIVGESAPIEPLLEANTPYTLNISKSKGSVTVNKPFVEGGWDEDEDATIIVDVEEFLKAATSGGSYSENGNTILESDGNGTTTLVRNIDFDNYDYSKLNGNYPNIPENITFDGGMHYIQNLHDPLFRYNSGNIKNLGIRSVNATNIISEENPDENLDNSRNGALCHYNSGVIENIRARNITLNVGVKSYVMPGTDGSETHNIGGLVGSNTGNISEVELGNNLSITVAGYTDSSFSNEVNASVLIGGVVGQNAANGKITDISILDNALTISIINNCEGSLGDYSVGGIVGQSSGYIIGVNLSNITIDGSQSSGVTSYMGGMIGQLTMSGNDGSLTNCVVAGTVKAGATQKYGTINSGSYIGGIAGAVYNMPVTGCRSMVDVVGPTVKNQGVIYATGGGFGRIRTADSYMLTNLIIWGSSLTGPTDYIGNFAGIAPNSSGWNDWYGNFGSYNITVRTFGSFQNIGFNMPDN